MADSPLFEALMNVARRSRPGLTPQEYISQNFPSGPSGVGGRALAPTNPNEYQQFFGTPDQFVPPYDPMGVNVDFDPGLSQEPEVGYESDDRLQKFIEEIMRRQR